MKAENLAGLSGRRVPSNGRVIDASRDKKVASLVPPDAEYSAIMPDQLALQIAGEDPKPRTPVRRPRGQDTAVGIPVQARHFLTVRKLVGYVPQDKRAAACPLCYGQLRCHTSDDDVHSHPPATTASQSSRPKPWQGFPALGSTSKRTPPSRGPSAFSPCPV